MRVTDWYWKRWIRRRGLKFSTAVSELSSKSTLKIEEGVRIGEVAIDTRELSVGANTYIRSECLLQVVGSIGRFCSISTGVVLGQEKHTHPLNWLSTHPFQYTDTGLEYTARFDLATIGHDVWIGHAAMVMEGVSVGTGAVIATRSLVTKDVPPYAVVAGVPAKVIRYRFPPEVIERLLASQWWERDIEQLKALPLDDPDACLEALESIPKVGYRKIQITRRGCQELV
ncbi:CatB-related O-acetyltransferase [Pseudomonas sp. 51_B]|uniref:CatB-related O-acetyltransferase n=1 Tax=Pseudomonas sp. 51_B TaxID=2813573 RepID=UPI001A9D301D|nr:CatB-related O-acetyltransferase [Pseudomonas sp. 51_B]